MKRFAKKLSRLGFVIAILCCTVIAVYAISRLFYSKSVTSNFSKKQIFEFELSASTMQAELGPGDSVSVNPIIKNSATEKMFVFIEVKTPVFKDEPLYEYAVNEDWVLVESYSGSEVFAYGGDQLTMLFPDESTTPLMSSITMKQVSNAEYSEIEDINISITGYAIDCQGYTTVPLEIWNEIKMLK